jgi:hypothetical protein
MLAAVRRPSAWRRLITVLSGLVEERRDDADGIVVKQWQSKDQDAHPFPARQDCDQNPRHYCALPTLLGSLPCGRSFL